MPRKLRELRTDLRRAGFFIDHQTGSHQVWKHWKHPELLVNVAGRDGADAKSYQERDVRNAVIHVTVSEKGIPL
jgi:predicted RNA binding protein YcfA (HicA-like mRNA interferase family)